MSTRNQKKSVGRIPKLRFGGFEGVWEERKLGEVVNLRKEKYSPQSDFDEKVCVELESLEKDSGKLLKTFEAKSLKSIKNVFYKGDVLYGKLRPYLKKFYKADFDGVCTTEIWVFSGGKNVINNFLYYLVQGNKFSYYTNVSTGSKMPRAEWGFIKNMVFNIPQKEEQKKIAGFLGVVDEWIGNLKRQKVGLVDYKRGVMQGIFSGGIGFRDGNGDCFCDWEERKLGEVLDYEQPTKYIVKNANYDNNYKIPVLTAGKSFILGYTNEEFGIFDAEKNPVIIFDDFTTAKQFVNFKFKVKSSAMKILKIKNDIADIRFVFALMQNIKFSLGEEHKRFWISEYSNIKIQLPSLPEQKKIADFLSSLDNLIQSKQDEIDKAEQWKRGLMQGLFV